jgi:transcriptional regulator with XRE-family HTH domain
MKKHLFLSTKKHYFCLTNYKICINKVAMTTLEKIGAKIRTIRVAKGLTQENIAEQLGMSHSGYAKIERGEVDMNISRLEQIAQKFCVDLAEIVQTNEVNNFNNHGTYSAVGVNATVNFHISKEEFENMKKETQGIKNK